VTVIDFDAAADWPSAEYTVSVSVRLPAPPHFGAKLNPLLAGVQSGALRLTPVSDQRPRIAFVAR
jgi:hypothetical protein